MGDLTVFGDALDGPIQTVHIVAFLLGNGEGVGSDGQTIRAIVEGAHLAELIFGFLAALAVQGREVMAQRLLFNDVFVTAGSANLLALAAVQAVCGNDGFLFTVGMAGRYDLGSLFLVAKGAGSGVGTLFFTGGFLALILPLYTENVSKPTVGGI